MKLNYEVEWGLEDEVIDNIVDEVENTLKQYSDCDVDDCIYEIVEDSLDNMGIDDCDHFNMDCYLDEVVEEVKHRYLSQKQKTVVFPTTPTEELHSGYIRRMDDLGRICIPKELRNLLNLEDGEPFEMSFDTKKNIILKKYHG